MPFPTPISAAQQTDIRASYRGKTALIFWDEEVLFKASVNQAVQATITSVTYDNVTIGAFTAILEGCTVYIGNESNFYDVPAVRQFRVRYDGVAAGFATSSVIYINETSAAVLDNMTIWVTKDIRLREKAAAVATDGTVSLDYNLPFAELPPIVYGLRSAYVISLSGGVADLALTPSVLLTTSGASAAMWTWYFVDGASFQAGNSSTQNVTLRWTAAGKYLVQVYHTDDGGRFGYFAFKVYVLDLTDLSSILFLGEDDLTWDSTLEDGFNASVRALSSIAALPDGVDCCAFTFDEQFGDDTTPVVANVNFVGRLRNESASVTGDADYAALTETRLTIEGFGAQLARLYFEGFGLTNAAVPAAYGEINNLTLWRAIVFVATGFCTLPNVCSLGFEDASDDYLVPVLSIGKSSLLDAINDILLSINAALMFAGQGEVYAARDIDYLDDADRPATRIVDFVPNADFMDYELDYEHADTIGQVSCYGGSYDTTALTTTVRAAVSPATIPRAQSRVDLNQQIFKANLTAEEVDLEAASRAARHLAAQNPKPRIRATLCDGYHWLTATHHLAVSMTLAAGDTPSGIAYTTADLWKVVEVHVSVDNEVGSKPTEGVFELCTQYGDSTIIVLIPPGEIAPDGSVTPPDDPYDQTPTSDGVGGDTDDTDTDNGGSNPNPPDDNPTNPVPSEEQKLGKWLVTWNAGKLSTTRNFSIATSPYWVDRSPAFSGLMDCAIAWSGNRAVVTRNSGGDTYVLYNSDLWGSAAWGTAAEVFLQQLYTSVRFAPNGDVWIYSPADATTTFDFTETENDWELYAATTGSYTAPYWDYEVSPPSTGQSRVYIKYRMRYNCKLASISITYEGASRLASPDSEIFVAKNNTGSILTSPEGYLNGVNTRTFTPDEPFLKDEYVVTGLFRNSPGATAATNTIRLVSFTLEGPLVYKSTNGGASFGLAKGVGGDRPGTGVDGGFDIQPAATGYELYAAAGGMVRVSTDDGVNWADETNGACVGSYPLAIKAYGKTAREYIFGSAAAVSGETLWNVSGGTKTDITPNDGSNNGVVVSQHAIAVDLTNTDRVYVIANFGGTVKFCRSTNGGSSWTISTPITNNAMSIDINPNNTAQLVIADHQTEYYSADYGANWTAKTAPGASLIGSWYKR